jgi:TonB family protein
MRELLVLFCAALPAAHAQDSPDARDLIMRSGGQPMGARSLRLSGTRTQEVAGQKTAATFTITIAGDGRARWEEKNPGGGRLQIWDGGSLWNYFPATNQYTQGPAPRAPDPEPINVIKFGRRSASLTSAAVVRVEPLNFGDKAVDCYVVRAEYSGTLWNPNVHGIVRTVWITRDRELVLKDSWEMEMPGSSPAMRGNITFTYSEIEWDAPVPDDLLVFQPPPGSIRIGPTGGSGGGGRDMTTPPVLPPGVYRPGNGVTSPVLISKVEPQYSEEARAAKYQGSVLLNVVIDAQGRPSDVSVLHALGLGLDEQAIEAVKQWRFEPGKRAGTPVPVMAQIEVNFRMQ